MTDMKTPVFLKLSSDRAVIDGVASGALDGKHALARLSEAALDSGTGVVVLDFDGVAAATGSFLRELIIGLRKFVTEHDGHSVLVLANMSKAVEDEVGFLAAGMSEAFLVSRVRKSGLTDVRLLGRIEPMQSVALEAVKAHGVADVAMLFKEGGDKVKSTAWNNRLSALREKGLVVETREGKSKKYRSTLEVLNG